MILIRKNGENFHKNCEQLYNTGDIYLHQEKKCSSNLHFKNLGRKYPVFKKSKYFNKTFYIYTIDILSCGFTPTNLKIFSGVLKDYSVEK